MTADPMAQPGVVEPEAETPRDDADDTPRGSNTRRTVVIVVLLALLALGTQVFNALIRTRSGHSDGKQAQPAPVPHSVIGVVAAPHSAVHVVAAPSFGHSHVRIRRAPLPSAAAHRRPRPHWRGRRRRYGSSAIA